MMKKGLIIAGASLLGGGLLIFAVKVALVLMRLFSPSESIGIIGGADAPTAIYLASSIRLLPLLGITGIFGVVCLSAGAIMLIVALIIFLTDKKAKG